MKLKITICKENVLDKQAIGHLSAKLLQNQMKSSRLKIQKEVNLKSYVISQIFPFVKPVI